MCNMCNPEADGLILCNQEYIFWPYHNVDISLEFWQACKTPVEIYLINVITSRLFIANAILTYWNVVIKM